MARKPSSNRFVVLLSLVVVGIVVVLFLFRGLSGESGGKSASLDGGSQSADQPRETLTALSANLEQVRAEQAQKDAEKAAQIQQLNAQNAELQSSLADAERTIMEEMKAMMKDVEDKVDTLSEPDALPEVAYPVVQPAPQRGQIRADGRVWFGAENTLGVGVVGGTGDIGGNGASSGLTSLPDRLSRIGGNVDGLDQFGIRGGDNGSGSSSSFPLPERLPAYTIAPDSVLVNSRGLTAIIGRVPIGGAVTSPIPFKVITGGDNLMPNDQALPEIAQAIWSGVAVGDAALHCVTGTLQSVTFIFADGTISTFPESGGGTGSIGWIANRQAYPCIPGKYVSNANEVLRQLFVAGFGQGIAGAFAQSNITQTANAAGGVTNVITGDTGEFAVSQGAAAGLAAWARYVAERARDVFDAVVVDPGEVLTIFPSQAIPIDYQFNGRRLRHVVAEDDVFAVTGGVD